MNRPRARVAFLVILGGTWEGSEVAIVGGVCPGRAGLGLGPAAAAGTRRGAPVGGAAANVVVVIDALNVVARRGGCVMCCGAHVGGPATRVVPQTRHKCRIVHDVGVLSGEWQRCGGVGRGEEEAVTDASGHGPL